MSIPSLAYLASFLSQMQRAVLDLTNPVSAVHTPLPKQPEPVNATPSSAKRPEYEVFFAVCEGCNARHLLYKSAADQQTRLN